MTPIKTFIALILMFAAILVSLPSVPTRAQAREARGCRSQRVRHVSSAHAHKRVQACRVSSSALVITPLAVPVGVPVAPRSFVEYSRFESRTESSAYRAPPGALESQSTPERMRATSLIARFCARCHSGKEPKAGFSLDEPGRLTADARLVAMGRVLELNPARRMPPSVILSPTDQRDLLRQIAGH